MKCNRIIFIGFGCFFKFACDLRLCIAQDDPRLAFAFCLGLLAHRILQLLRNDYIPDFDRLHRNAPGFGTGINYSLKLCIQFFAANQQIREHGFANDVPHSCLRGPTDCRVVVLNFKRCFLRIPDNPKQYRIDIDGYSVLGERFFCCE